MLGVIQNRRIKGKSMPRRIYLLDENFTFKLCLPMLQGVPHQYGLNQYEFLQYAFSKNSPEIQLVRFCLKKLHLYDFILYDFASKSSTCTISTNMNCHQIPPTCTISTMYGSLKLMYSILKGNVRTAKLGRWLYYREHLVQSVALSYNRITTI